ncbi:MAG: hypothetical protein K2H52_04530 [Lachnospiraceae bacterium]|nr:hypothetical protein [Lachnospiraceae bacterium]
MRILAAAMSVVMMLSSGMLGTLGNPRSSYGLGSAAYLKGRNLLYSLYVDTTESSWNKEKKEEVLSKLEIASAYIENSAKQYHEKVELVCNWQENQDLTGSAKIKFPINDKVDFVEKLDQEIALWVEEKVDYDALMEAYEAEGIALLVFVNNSVSSYAIVFDGMDNPKESVVLAGEETPAAYAHEILHVFGAHDLYKDAEYTKDVTDYVKKAYPMEIMYTVTDANGKKYEDQIVNEISPITAYHLGWIDYTEEIDVFPQLRRKQKNEREKTL